LEGIWPKVLEAVPDAELHIYYGWNSFDKVAEHFPYLKPFRGKLNELLLQSKNVTQHGRIPQDRLAAEFLKSDIWLYPTYFPETYCITAVEAQLAGCIPVTTQLAALRETCRSGIFINGDVKKEEVQQAFAEATIELLKDSKRGRLRKGIKKNAPHTTWKDVASVWQKQWLGKEPALVKVGGDHGV
jgi:glycosyltransferase involved in cell wall biosynthesis